jgi:hypothetical protein
MIIHYLTKVILQREIQNKSANDVPKVSPEEDSPEEEEGSEVVLLSDFVFWQSCA